MRRFLIRGKMKILVIGCGSIGQRHAKNARKLGAEVMLCDSDLDRANKLAESIGASAVFADYEMAAKDSGAYAAVVATPTHLHAGPAHALIANGIHVLMEKPLCPSVADALQLRRAVKKSGIVFMMGHTYRFRGEWLEVKRILELAPLGKVHSAELAGGWHLPDWHIFEDYRKEYAAQERLGGGVRLTNLSHIFDIVSWLFGDILKQSGVELHVGDLDVDVEDMVHCSLLTKKNIAVLVTEDFLSRCPRRFLRVNAEHGFLEADFNRRTVAIWDARKKRFLPEKCHSQKPPESTLFRILEDGVAYNLEADISSLEHSVIDAYLAELEYFMEIASCQKPSFDLDIDSGIKVLRALQSRNLKSWKF